MGKSISATFITVSLIGLLLVSCGQFTSDTIYLQTTSLGAGGDEVCATVIDSTFKCWGANGSGQLGQGDTVNRGDAPKQMGNDLKSIDVGSKRSVAAFTVGGSHVCAQLDNQTVKCWGANGSGQLGLGDTVNRGDAPGQMGDNLPAVDLGTDRKALILAAGQAHTCAILDNYTVKCWGDNSYGQLGLGDTANRGDGPNEMGDNLPPVDLGTDSQGFPLDAFALAAGAYHTCALLFDNVTTAVTAKCWGDNSNGQLGQGSTNNLGDEPGEMGDNLPAIDLGTGRTSTVLAAGQAHTCAVLDDGTAKCWGDNSAGQLGQGDTATMPDIGDAPGEMGDTLPPIELGTGLAALIVSAGGATSCALLSDLTVKCWGDNSDGQLGQGDTVNRGDDPGEMGDNLPAIDLEGDRTAVAVVSGVDHTCALLGNQRVKCWGLNDMGQLGLGDTDNRGDGPDEMGKSLPWINVGTT